MKKTPRLCGDNLTTDGHRLIRVAAAVDFRGDDENSLFFIFRCPPRLVVEEVFRFLIAQGTGIADKAVVSDEHDIIRRNGRGFWRIAVEICAPHYHFTSLQDMQLLIQSVFLRLYPCSFKWVNIDKFLNL